MNKRYQRDRVMKVFKINESLQSSEERIKHIIKKKFEIDSLVDDTPFFNLSDNQYTYNETITEKDIVQILNFDHLPESLNPSSGELEDKLNRVIRKQNQLSSLIHYITKEIDYLHGKYPNDIVRIIEIGAGSGHLSLILAYMYPNIEVLTCERKEYSVRCCEKRVSTCQLANVTIYNGDIRDISTVLKSDYCRNKAVVVVGLHLCGFLTDFSLSLSKQLQSSFVITPCCYGQISKPPPGLFDGSYDLDNSLIDYRSSYNIFDTNSLKIISSGADYAHDLDNNSNVLDNKDFIIAKRCMRCIDIDRLIHYMETSNCYCKLASLNPLSCSQKNNVIIGRYL